MDNAPIQAAMVDPSGRAGRIWSLFFSSIVDRLSGKFPVQLKSCLVASVPDASFNEGAIVYISNEAGGKTLAFSDGVNWRRVQDRAIIS
jgi:hypothetical protein